MNPPPDPDVLDLSQLDPEDAKRLLRAMTFDAANWFAHYAKIRTKEGAVLPVPAVNKLQKRVLDHYRYCQLRGIPCLIMILKPRQKGASTIAEGVIYHHMRRFPELNGVIMGDVDATSEKVFAMFKRYAELDLFPWGDGLGPLKDELNKSEHVTLPNGSTYSTETAGSKNAGRSGTVQVLHLDEVAFFNQDKGKDPTTAVLGSFAKDLPKSLGFATSTANGACYDDQTEVLTDQGWKLFKDLTGAEAILTKDPATSVAYYQSDWIPQVHRYAGPMVHFAAQSVNLAVTPNHMMWMSRQKGPMRFTRADSVIGNTTDYNFDRALKWAAPGVEKVIIPAYTHVQGAGMRTRPAVEIGINEWLVFLGHWIADGHLMKGRCKKEVVLTQRKFVDEFRASAAAIARALGAKLKEIKHGNARRFIIYSAQLVSYMQDLHMPKRIPRELLMSMSSAQCRILLEAIYEGDGCLHKRKGEGNKVLDYGRIYVGIDKELEDDVQELSLKAGYATNAYGPPRNRVVAFTESTKATVKFNNPPSVVEGYDGVVYCVTLPKDHLLMVRRKRIAQWCGNSGWFYNTWNGKNAWHKIFAAWYEFDDSTRKFYDPDERAHFEESLTDDEKQEKQLYPEVTLEHLNWRRNCINTDYNGDVGKFRQEMPSNDEECFLLSSSPRFYLPSIKSLEAEAKTNDKRRRCNLLIQTHNSVALVPDPKGDVFIQEEPIVGCKYIGGLDTMTGEDQSTGATAQRDWHSAQIWRAGYMTKGGDWQRPALVALHHSQVDTDVLAEIFAGMSIYYGRCMTIPEINGQAGIHIVKELQKYKVPMFRRRAHSAASKKKMTDEEILGAYGWNTDKQTKKWLIDALVPMIRKEELDVKFSEVLDEFRTFIINANGTCEAMSGKHDDHVVSAGLCVYNIGSATEYRERPGFFGSDANDGWRTG